MTTHRACGLPLLVLGSQYRDRTSSFPASTPPARDAVLVSGAGHGAGSGGDAAGSLRRRQI